VSEGVSEEDSEEKRERGAVLGLPQRSLLPLQPFQPPTARNGRGEKKEKGGKEGTGVVLSSSC